MRCWKCGNYTDQKYCPECGANVKRRKKPKQSKGVTITKLVIGIVSIVLFVFTMLQSCAVASVGALVSEETAASGIIGILLAFSLLIAGIVGIATRTRRVGGLAAAAIWLVGACIGFVGSSAYGDLSIWSFLALMFGIAYFVMTLLSFNKRNFYKKWWFYAICLLIALALIAMLTHGAARQTDGEKPVENKLENKTENNAQKNDAESGGNDTQQTAHNPAETLQAETAQNQETAGVFETENFKVTYLSHSVVKNYSDEDCIDIVFEFINYGEEPTSFDAVTYCKAFQDGIQLESAYYNNEDCVEWGTQVKANTPVKTNETLKLRNTTSPVELMVEEFFSLSDKKTEITLELN